MVLDSYEALEAFTIVVWFVALMLFLVVVALSCPQPERVVR
jgi:Mn2+/Fe2+ NRAMP family transporter